MQYKLVSLEEFFSINLPVTFEIYNDTETLSRYLGDVERMVDQLRNSMLDSLSGVNAGSLSSFVPLHVAGLVKMTQQLECHYYEVTRRREPSSKQVAQFYCKICDRIAELIGLFKDTLPAYFNKDLAIPFSLRQQYARSFAQRLKKTQDRRLELTALNQPLINIVEAPILKFTKSDEPTSYAEVEYLQKLMKELVLLGQNEDADVDREIHRRLITINFNAPAYIDLCIGNLVKKFKSVGEVGKSKWIRALRRYQKDIQQVLPDKTLAFIPDHHSAKEQLLNWITQELVFEEDNLQLINSGKAGMEKIATSLNVGELSLLFSTLMDISVIPSQNKTAVYRLVVRYFATNGTDSISLDSITNKSNGNVDSIPRVWEIFEKGISSLRKKIK